MASNPVTTLEGKPIMAAPIADKVTLYDKDGNASEHFPVDANEILAAGGGYTREKPKGKAAADDDPKRKADASTAKDEPDTSAKTDKAPDAKVAAPVKKP